MQRAGVGSGGRPDRDGSVGVIEAEFKCSVTVSNSREIRIDGGCAMRIQNTDERERLWSDLREATGCGHTSQALDRAARYYLRMAGHGVRQGQLEAALEIVADEAGHEVASEVADVLDAPELSVRYDVDVASGVGDE